MMHVPACGCYPSSLRRGVGRVCPNARSLNCHGPKGSQAPRTLLTPAVSRWSTILGQFPNKAGPAPMATTHLHCWPFHVFSHQTKSPGCSYTKWSKAWLRKSQRSLRSWNVAGDVRQSPPPHRISVVFTTKQDPIKRGKCPLRTPE